MTSVEVPGAAEAGAIYPNSKPAGYELHYTGSTGWIIHLSGGGWRFLAKTTDAGSNDAHKTVPPLTADGMRLREDIGGAGADDLTTASAGGGCYGSCDGIMSMDESQNPLFHSFNKIFVPISGTSFTGDRTSDKVVVLPLSCHPFLIPSSSLPPTAIPCAWRAHPQGGHHTPANGIQHEQSF
jgi:hypothetical protein